MAEKLTIIKVSGKVIENPDALKVFVKALGQIKGKKLLIHSAAALGKTVASKLGITYKEVNGRPVVDNDTLTMLSMVYGGLINKQLVALLQGRKINALGLTGADMGLITASQTDEGLGLTGGIKQVDTKALSALIDSGTVPVFAPFVHDGKSNILFTETDAMAATVAMSLALRYEVDLIYCFERNGVLLNVQDPDSVVPVLRRTQYKRLRDMAIINDWFVNKLDNAFSAIDHGVKSVTITCPQSLGDPKAGTRIG